MLLHAKYSIILFSSHCIEVTALFCNKFIKCILSYSTAFTALCCVVWYQLYHILSFPGFFLHLLTKIFIPLGKGVENNFHSSLRDFLLLISKVTDSTGISYEYCTSILCSDQ